ncbi:alpha-aminoadipic semialdehyde synthase [Paragonimus westermani]|uniref:Alpha-aminoadipic semialdehyde synthase n=1 Tax=Paragonimus westermani TaxID=34504 RepID=A0A5J4N7B8_9TREM|nr:alpha-aminoadipic semialdehyde synthase [Paragonimus westermani]
MSDATKPFADYNARPEVKNAVITSNGELTPKFKYIDDLRAKRRTSISTSSERKVLVLGAGYVVPPLLEYLTRDGNLRLTVVSNLQDELASISQNFPKIQARNVNVLEDTKMLNRLVCEHDLVISLIPWKFHPTVVEECVKQKRNLLTASYCTPVLRDMESSIQQSGITAFMEMGLDPGIDHLLTKECIDEVTQKGGHVVSYRSFTGGLPAPENSNNPLRYKFSWSPEAAMSTVMNGAKYLENGEIKEIPADGSLMRMASAMDVFPGFNLEGYPNRDSTRYIDLYGLQGCHTVIRGTLRYGGYTNAVSVLLQLGLLHSKPEPILQPGSPNITWRQLICQKLSLDEKLNVEQMERAILNKFGNDKTKYACLHDLGFLSDDPVAQAGTPLASTSEQLSKVIAYGR